MRLTGYGLALLGAALMGGATQAQTPSMTRQQAAALYAAAGFPISADGKNPTNRCRQAANPRILFVDMNGDGRREAQFIDAGTCYQPDGRWYALVTQGTDGRWRRILEGPGSVAAVGTMANGWFVLNTTSGGRSQVMAYNGQAYAPRAATSPVQPPAGQASPAPSAVPAQTPAARDAAIFRAAGFTQIRGKWESGCNDPTTGAPYTPGAIAQVKDLNGDGRPEAVVTEGGSFCYGNTGEAFWLLSQQANGSWKLLFNQTGIAEFLPVKGAGGWPDISIGGPGFCFPVVRWNGSAYVRNRYAYEGKPCRPGG